MRQKSKKNNYSQQTRNPCNQFLVQYLVLIRQKQTYFKAMKGKNRYDHQFHIYTKAIDSIKKYPLPIICYDQLMLLAGIGDCLSGKLVAVIKEHYINFLKEGKQTEEQITKQISQRQKSNSKALNLIHSDYSNSKMMSVKSENDHSQQQPDSQKRDKMLPFAYNDRMIQVDLDEKSVKSQNLNRKGVYKPRQGSQSANMMKAMKLLNASSCSVTRNDIDKCLLENNCEKIKQWKCTKDSLINNGYIESDSSVDYQAFFMTARGEVFAIQNSETQNSNLTKKKMVSEIKSFKSKIIEKQKQQASLTQIMNQSSQMSSKNISMNDLSLFRKQLQRQAQQKVIILIDTRQMKDQSERTYFQETLTQKYKIEVMTHSLTIGDFAFAYNGQILDYIIERKKADDLAASITDGRYKEQKYRLKNCGAKNVIYLYEGYPSEGSLLKQKQLMNALLKTRVTDGFKVYKAARINETVRFLAQMQSELQTRVNMDEQVITIGTLQQFNHRNSKNRYLTIQNIFGFGLKSFPNVGKQTVTNILRYFKSFSILYKQLQKYQNNGQRVQFLNGLLKGGRTQANVTCLIVQFLFNDHYITKINNSHKLDHYLSVNSQSDNFNQIQSQ